MQCSVDLAGYKKCIFVEIFRRARIFYHRFLKYAYIHFAHYIHFTRRGLLFNTLKTLQAIVMKRCKLVYVSQRDALIITCKCDDVFHIQVRLHRLELVYASRETLFKFNYWSYINCAIIFMIKMNILQLSLMCHYWL